MCGRFSNDPKGSIFSVLESVSSTLHSKDLNLRILGWGIILDYSCRP